MKYNICRHADKKNKFQLCVEVTVVVCLCGGETQKVENPKKCCKALCTYFRNLSGSRTLKRCT